MYYNYFILALLPVSGELKSCVLTPKTLLTAPKIQNPGKYTGLHIYTNPFKTEHLVKIRMKHMRQLIQLADLNVLAHIHVSVLIIYNI